MMLDIFVISFLVALTGALSPGPVLTFTVYKSLESEKGYLAGLFIIAGHALLEFLLLFLLLLGLSVLFQNVLVLIIIGVIGGIILTIFGFLTLKVIQDKDFEIDFSLAGENDKGFKGNSFLGGIVLSLSNPYWLMWWAIVGLGLMINLGISFDNPLGLLVFFIGHELGDLAFYVPISIFVHLGGKSLNPSIYKKVLIVSALFMIGFGAYIAIRTVLIPPQI